MQTPNTTSLDIHSPSESLLSCGVDMHAPEMRVTVRFATAIATTIGDRANGTNPAIVYRRPFGASLSHKQTPQA
jgi:hypothetical protein